MAPGFWAHVHGAAVHFPVVLPAVALVCDAAGLAGGRRAEARLWWRIGAWMLAAAAAGALAAAFSGLVLTRGLLFGHAALRMHHLAAWPAVLALTGLAAGRSLAGPPPTRIAATYCIAGDAVVAGLVGAAGYWGGVLLLGS